MMYVEPASLAQLVQDIRAFYHPNGVK